MQGYDVADHIEPSTLIFQPHIRKYRVTQQVVANMALGRLRPLFNRFRARGPFVKQTSFILFNFITWIPAVIWFNSNVGDIVWIQGGSMYPYLNTDINRTTKKDACWNSKWEPLEGLRRGMIVSFWFVASESI